MGRKSFEVEVNPEVIKWARESIGLSPQDVAKRLKMTKENYLAIEKGKKLPTYVQLSKLAEIFERPLSALLLPKPPEEPSIELVFRTLPQVERPLSPETRLVIREARYLQSIARELMEALGKSTKPLISKFSLEDDPVEVAKEERKKLGIDFETQMKWRNVHIALNAWREAVENKNIFVLQESLPDEVRGFPLMNEPSFIVLNTRHIPAARIFTLFHEYAHLLLREAEVFPEEENELEHWCDNFASELLLPEKLLTKELMTEEKDFFLPILLGSPIDLQSLLGVCRKLSDKFKVSREAILKKLQRLVPDKIDKKIYQAACQVWNREEKRQYFPLGPIERTLLRRGNSFVRLIMEAHKEKLITTADFLELLSLKLEHLSKPSFYKLLGTSK